MAHPWRASRGWWRAPLGGIYEVVSSKSKRRRASVKRRKARASRGRTSQLRHFLFADEAHSVPPTITSVATSVIVALTSALFAVALLSESLVAAVVVLVFGWLFAILIPARIYLNNLGIEQRRIFGVGKEFGQARVCWWGRRVEWHQVRSFSIKENRYRRPLQERLGNERAIVRAKGMPTVVIHSSFKSFATAQRLANSHLPEAARRRAK